MAHRDKMFEIFKASPTPTSILKPTDGKYIFLQVNDAFCSMTQLSVDELSGHEFLNKFPKHIDDSVPEISSKLRQSFETVLKTKVPDELDCIRYDVIHDDNKRNEAYWKIVNTPVLDTQGNVELIINSAILITDQVLSERINNLMLNNSEDSFIYLNADLSIKGFNENFQDLFYELFDEQIQKDRNIFEFFDSERFKKIHTSINSVLDGDQIEQCIKFTDSKNEHRYFTLKFKPVFESGIVSGVFISMWEITRERNIQIKLKQNEAHFRALAENGSDILFILDAKGKPKYASPSVLPTLGYTPTEALELDIFSSIHPDDREMVQTELHKCLNQPGKPIKVPPARLKDNKGNWHWFEGTITNMLDVPAIEGIVDNFREITERIEAEQKTLKAKEQYQSLIDTIDGVIWESDPVSLEVKFASDQIRNLLGYSPEDWIENPNFWEERLHPNDRKRVLDKFHKEIKEGRHHELEYRFRRSDGKYIWIRDLISVLSENGSPAIIRGIMVDITKEIELQNKLSEAYRISKIGNWDLDLVNNKLSWSNYVKELHEVGQDYTPDLISALNFYKEGTSREKIKKVLERSMQEGTSFDEELVITTAKGNEKWVRAVGQPDFINNKCVRIFGSTQDITDRKTIEIELKKSNKRLEERIKEQRCLYMVSNLDDKKLQINELLQNAIEIIPDGWLYPELVHVELIHNEKTYTNNKSSDFGSGYKVTQKMVSEGNTLKVTVGYPETSELPNDIKIFEDEERELLNALCSQIIQKVSQIQKREELMSVQKKYKNVVEHSTNMFYQHNTDGLLTYISHQSDAFLGYPPEEAKKNWDEFITDHPINLIGKELTRKAIETGKIQEPYELQLKTGDGRIIWVYVQEAPLLENGKVVGIVGSLSDITERKIFEENLQISLERYNYVAKATQDALYDRNILKDKVDWGDGFQSLFGHEPSDMIKYKDLKKLVHPDDIDTIDADLEFTLNDISMNKWIVEYRIRRKNGSYANVIDTAYILRDEDGNAYRMIGALRDVTEQKEIEEEIKNSLKEKETLLAEIHHRVKNNLAVVSGMMQLQAFDSENKQLQEKLYDSVFRIKTMASVHELLYQSNSFSQLDFSETITKLVNNISETLQQKDPVNPDFDCHRVKLNINKAIPASLIVNEVVTNTFKHAFKGIKNKKLKISLLKEQDTITISIRDNGVGFPKDFDPSKQSSLGMHLINVLTEQICAEYEYKNNDNNGTLFSMRFTNEQ